jgi:hypothetical protein
MGAAALLAYQTKKAGAAGSFFARASRQLPY